MIEAHAVQSRGSELSDDAIVERVRAGELELFELLLRRHNQRLYRVARAVVRDEREAEDVMQEAYARAFACLGQYAGRARFSTWLTKIALHEALARVRRDSKLVYLADARDERSGVESLMSAERDPEASAGNAELGELLADSVDTLPETLRVAFVLREVEGLDTAETAELLGLSSEAVKVRLHRARTALRRSIDERLGTEARRLYDFHLSRCDRVVQNVMRRISATAQAGKVSP